MPQQTLDFDGATFDPALDGPRMGEQLEDVYQYMSDGRWWTLSEIAKFAVCSEASASARLRDLRKAKFGRHTVERRRVPEGNGLHEYRLLIRAPSPALDTSGPGTAPRSENSAKLEGS